MVQLPVPCDVSHILKPNPDVHCTDHVHSLPVSCIRKVNASAWAQAQACTHLDVLPERTEQKWTSDYVSFSDESCVTTDCSELLMEMTHRQREGYLCMCQRTGRVMVVEEY